MEQIVQQQAVLLSCIDVFALCAIISAMLLPVPLVLLVPQPATAARPERREIDGYQGATHRLR
jgi:hypothetical protein